MKMKMKMKIFTIALFILTIAPLTSYSADSTSGNNQQASTTKEKPLYWVDPMEPTVHYSAPGKSRMGMKLEPVYAKEKGQQ